MKVEQADEPLIDPMNLRVDTALSPASAAPPLPGIARLAIPRWRGWLVPAVAMAGMLVAGAAGSWLFPSTPNVQYTTAPVTLGPVTRTVTATVLGP